METNENEEQALKQNQWKCMASIKHIVKHNGNQPTSVKRIGNHHKT